MLLERESQDQPSLVGSIFLGKVRRVVPAMACAFLNIGIERDAFLHLDDLSSDPSEDIRDLVAPGEKILIQVTRDLWGKGPRVTTRISLAGRLLVLLPTGDGVGVSRKIENGERTREDLTEALGPMAEDYGWIVRTAAADAGRHQFTKQANFLVDQWKAVVEGYRSSKHPHCLYSEPNLAIRAIRDLADLSRIVVHGPACDSVGDWLQRNAEELSNMELDPSSMSLFVDRGLETEIAKLHKPWVPLPSGGSVVIETTEALVAIDVNSGSDTGGTDFEELALTTNLEAAGEICRQVRVRGLGGLIVIDFIDMRRASDREQLLDHLREAAREDPERVLVGGMSRFGLVDLTRKQSRVSYFDQSQRSCPVCRGRGKIASIRCLRSQVRNDLAAMDRKDDLTLRVAPETAERLGSLDELVPVGTAVPKVVADSTVAPSGLAWSSGQEVGQEAGQGNANGDGQQDS